MKFIIFIIMFFVSSVGWAHQWKCVSVDIYKRTYNVIADKWEYEKNLDINVLETYFDAKDEKFFVSIQATGIKYLSYNQDYDFYYIDKNHSLVKIDKDPCDVESVGYIVRDGNPMDLSFELPQHVKINNTLLEIEVRNEQSGDIYIIRIFYKRI
ncbi:hypothetical protein B5F71_18090 [Bacteroides sp. An269]|nr:hypothetical protein B5F71_18090 [Bacteroides sp. An269]